MPRLSRIPKALLAALTGLTAALAVTAPAGAQDPAPEPRTFFVQDAGEDGCAHFHSSGQIERHDWTLPEGPLLTVSGWKAIAIPDFDPENPRACLPHPNFDRQIEFRVFGAGMPLGEHIVPFGAAESGTDYAFDFTSRINADTVKVAICLERRPDGSTWPDRCGEEQTVDLDEVTPEPDPRCEYSLALSQWGGGFLAQLAITPLGSASGGWKIEAALPEGSAVTSMWNAELEQHGSTIIMTNTPWNGTIEAGGSAQVGFVGSGEPPTEILVSVDGEACAQAEA